MKDSEIRCRIEGALPPYLSGVKELGLISTVILGVGKDESEAYIFNVLKRTIQLGDAADHRYALLTKLGGQLQRALAPEVPTRVSYVNPSRVDELHEQCKRLKIGLIALELDSPQPIPHDRQQRLLDDQRRRKRLEEDEDRKELWQALGFYDPFDDDLF